MKINVFLLRLTVYLNNNNNKLSVFMSGNCKILFYFIKNILFYFMSFVTLHHLYLIFKCNWLTHSFMKKLQNIQYLSYINVLYIIMQ